MNKANKEKLLQVYDLMTTIVDYGNGKRFHEAMCGECQHMNSSGSPHPETCELNKAIGTIGARIPAFSDRAKWLAE